MPNSRIAKADGDFPQLMSRSIIKKHKGKIYPFSKLPLTAQLSIAHYMGVDGAAWMQKDDFGVFDNGSRYIIEGLISNMDKIVAHYGTMEIGYVILSAESLKEFWKNCESDSSKHFDNFDAFHKWYQSVGNHIKNPTWPVILSDFDDEILQDGWHRFHAYIEIGATEIPAVWYPGSGVTLFDN